MWYTVDAPGYQEMHWLLCFQCGAGHLWRVFFSHSLSPFSFSSSFLAYLCFHLCFHSTSVIVCLLHASPAQPWVFGDEEGRQGHSVQSSQPNTAKQGVASPSPKEKSALMPLMPPLYKNQPTVLPGMETSCSPRVGFTGGSLSPRN